MARGRALPGRALAGGRGADPRGRRQGAGAGRARRLVRRLPAAAPGACVVVLVAEASVTQTLRLMQHGARAVACSRAGLLEEVHAALVATQPEAVRPRWTQSERAIFGKIVNRSSVMNSIIE